MEYFPYDRADKECCDRGTEHESDRFAELAPEFPVKNNGAVKSESRDKEDADGG